MPIGQKYVGQNVFAQKRRKSKKATNVTIVAKPHKLKVYGMDGPEMKHLDNNYQYTALSTGSVDSLSSIAQGTTAVTRIGGKIEIKSVGVNIYVRMDNNAAHTANIHKFCLVLDKEPEAGGIAAYGDIFETVDPMSWREHTTSDRFVILKDWVFVTGPMDIQVNTGSNNLQAYSISPGNSTGYKTLFKRINVNAKYIGTGATQASIGSNQLLLTSIAYITDANTDHIMSARIRFLDE